VNGLIIRRPWIDLILSGEKTWEMRSRNTEIRGRIALIGKGAKAVTGVAELVDLRPNLSLAELRSSFAKHRVPEDELSCEDFKWTTAWVLSGAQTLEQPVPYHHRAGAVIWVRLEPEVAVSIEEQLRARCR
jgi:hypothetical protein